MSTGATLVTYGSTGATVATYRSTGATVAISRSTGATAVATYRSTQELQELPTGTHELHRSTGDSISTYRNT